MIHRLYCSSGNTVGVHEYIGVFEIDPSDHCTRYVEIKADGTVLRYDLNHDADAFGQLPEGRWEEIEASKQMYGTYIAISSSLFESVWSAVHGANEIPY